MTVDSNDEGITGQMNDDTLVSGCIKGDKQCQRLLFRKYRQNVLNLVSHTLGSRFDLDDIVQQIFIKVFRSLTLFKGLSSLDTWIYRITAKVCIDQLRKKYRKRQVTLFSDTEGVEQEACRESSTGANRQEEKELLKQIYEGLNKIGIEKRIVVTLFEVEGFSLQEISEIVDKPIGTIKSRLFHGRRQLALYLKKYLDTNHE